MDETQRNMTVKGIGIEVTPTFVRYCQKMTDSLRKYLPKDLRESLSTMVTVSRVNRAHGNKYEVTCVVRTRGKTYEASDSTLNVFAALDIVRLKLVRELQKDAR